MRDHRRRPRAIDAIHRAPASPSGRARGPARASRSPASRPSTGPTIRGRPRQSPRPRRPPLPAPPGPTRRRRCGVHAERRRRSPTRAARTASSSVATSTTGSTRPLRSASSADAIRLPIDRTGARTLDRVRPGRLAYRPPLHSSGGRIRGPLETLLGRRTRRAAASRGGCPSTADDQGKGRVTHSSPLSTYSAPGACGKTRVVPQNRRPRPEPADMGVATCVCCCRRTVLLGTVSRDEPPTMGWTP